MYVFPLDPNGPGPTASAAGLELALFVMVGILGVVALTVLMISIAGRRTEKPATKTEPAPPPAPSPMTFQITFITVDVDDILLDGLIHMPGMENRVPFTVAALLDTSARLGLGRGPLSRWAEDGTPVEFRLLISADGRVSVQLRSDKERVVLRVLGLAPALHTRPA